MQGRTNGANLTAGNKRLVARIGYHTEASISEEPGAVVPHAGICAGVGRVTALPTATNCRKSPFSKNFFEKWGRNIEKRLVFCVPNNILAIFKPSVGDFCKNFSNKGFFDSLVGQFLAKHKC